MRIQQQQVTVKDFFCKLQEQRERNLDFIVTLTSGAKKLGLKVDNNCNFCNGVFALFALNINERILRL